MTTQTATKTQDQNENSWFSSQTHIADLKKQILTEWVDIDYRLIKVGALTDALKEAREEAKKSLMEIVNIVEEEEDSLE